jgi:hypothetical protein
MYDFAIEGPFDVDRLRQRLYKMTDEKLIEFGRWARYMCSPQAHWGPTPRESHVIQLREAIAEWKRRQSKTV